MKFLKENSDVCFILALAVFIFGLYACSMRAPFYFDDGHMIERNLFIKDPRLFSQVFKGYVTSDTISRGMLRPLLMMTFMANYWSGGLDTLSYHLLNALLHFICAVLVFFLLRQIMPQAPPLVLYAVTFLFAAHPLHTEAVTYISSRSDLMVTAAVLGSCIACLRGRMVYAAALYAMGLLVKETALCVPLLIFSWDVIQVPRYTFKSIKEYCTAHKRWQVYAGLIVCTGVYFWYRASLGAPATAVSVRPLGVNILTQAAITFFYIRLFLIPYPLVLTHSFSNVTSIFSFLGFFSTAGIMGMIVYALRVRRRWPIAAFGIAWFLVCLAPKFYARLFYPACEHHFYMPSVGMYIVLTLGAVYAYTSRPSRRRALAVIAGILICVWSALTIARNLEYTDPLRFWSLAAERDPHSAIAHNQLGFESMQRGFFKQAEQAFMSALIYATSTQDIINSKGNLAGIYRHWKQYDRALALLDELTRINPIPPKTYENIGIIYMDMGREQDALDAWEKEIAVYPQVANVYALIGLHWVRKAEYRTAQNYFHRAVSLNPDTYLAYYGLGKASEMTNDLVRAAAYYRKTISCMPFFFDAYYALGTVYARQSDARAIAVLEAAIRIKPDIGRAYNDLAALYVSLEQPDYQKARVYADKARELGYEVNAELLALLEIHAPEKKNNREK